ncbi:MAG: hypothetical protein KF770_15525 [Anaerolineae bacterium]|nr:hypothetical protein [Anaerolineae bacterium]
MSASVYARFNPANKFAATQSKADLRRLAARPRRRSSPSVSAVSTAGFIFSPVNKFAATQSKADLRPLAAARPRRRSSPSVAAVSTAGFIFRK